MNDQIQRQADQERIELLEDALRTLIRFDALYNIQSRLSSVRANAWNDYILMVLSVLPKVEK